MIIFGSANRALYFLDCNQVDANSEVLINLLSFAENVATLSLSLIGTDSGNLYILTCRLTRVQILTTFIIH